MRRLAMFLKRFGPMKSRLHVAGWLPLVLLCFLSAEVVNTASADPVEVVRFHGVINLLQGSPPSDGTYVFRVEVFDVAVGGTPLLSIDTATLVTSNMYTLTISPVQPGDISAAFTEGPRFIETTVVSGPGGPINQVLTPRQEVASVPFAITGGNATPHVTEAEVKTWASEVQPLVSVVSDNVGAMSCTGECFVPCLPGAAPIACNFRKNTTSNEDADVVGCLLDVAGGQCSFRRDVQGSNYDDITLYCTCLNPQ